MQENPCAAQTVYIFLTFFVFRRQIGQAPEVSTILQRPGQIKPVNFYPFLAPTALVWKQSVEAKYIGDPWKLFPSL